MDVCEYSVIILLGLVLLILKLLVLIFPSPHFLPPISKVPKVKEETKKSRTGKN